MMAMNDAVSMDVSRTDKAIGAKVSALRLRNGFSVSDVAAHLDLLDANYIDAERGDYSLSVVDIVLLADLYRVGIGQLIPDKLDVF